MTQVYRFVHLLSDPDSGAGGGALREKGWLLQSPLGVVVPDGGAFTEAADCVLLGLHPPPSPAA